MTSTTSYVELNRKTRYSQVKNLNSVDKIKHASCVFQGFVRARKKRPEVHPNAVFHNIWCYLRAYKVAPASRYGVMLRCPSRVFVKERGTGWLKAFQKCVFGLCESDEDFKQNPKSS